MLGYTSRVWTWRPPPRCGPGDPPWVWARRPHLGVGLETPLAKPLNLPPRCGPGSPRPDPSTSPPPGVGLEIPPARPFKLPPGCGPGNLQGMLGYTPPWRPARHAGIPPARHAGIYPRPTHEQNHTDVLEHNLAPTSSFKIVICFHPIGSIL